MDRFHEYNPAKGRPLIKGDSGLVDYGAVPVFVELSGEQAVAASNTYLHAAVADNGSEQVITTNITQPPAGTARIPTVTATGTAGDVKAGVQHTFVGADLAGNPVTALAAAFAADTLATKACTVALARIDKIIQPPHDGTGVSFSYGFSNGFGLRQLYSRNSVVKATLGGSPEATLPTMTYSPTVLAANTLTLSTSLNGTPVAAFLLI